MICISYYSIRVVSVPQKSSVLCYLHFLDHFWFRFPAFTNSYSGFSIILLFLPHSQLFLLESSLLLLQVNMHKYQFTCNIALLNIIGHGKGEHIFCQRVTNPKSNVTTFFKSSLSNPFTKDRSLTIRPYLFSQYNSISASLILEKIIVQPITLIHIPCMESLKSLKGIS